MWTSEGMERENAALFGFLLLIRNVLFVCCVCCEFSFCLVVLNVY